MNHLGARRCNPGGFRDGGDIGAHHEIAIAHDFLCSNRLRDQHGDGERERERANGQTHIYKLRSCRYSASHCVLTDPMSSSRCRHRDSPRRITIAKMISAAINHVTIRGYAGARGRAVPNSTERTSETPL
jgi:hypothetical protein